MSSENNWEDASSDEDYHYEEEDSEAEAEAADNDMDDELPDPTPAFMNPGLTQQLLQQFTGTGLFATLNEAFEEWDDLEAEEDFGVDQLLYDGVFPCPGPTSLVWLTAVSLDAEFEFAVSEPFGLDHGPNSVVINTERPSGTAVRVAGSVRGELTSFLFKKKSHCTTDQCNLSLRFSSAAVPNSTRHMLLSHEQLRYLIRHDMLLGDLRNSRRLSPEEFDEWMESRRPDPNRFPKVPNEAGRELMYSGQFGANPPVSEQRMKKDLARRVLDRELGISNPAETRKTHRLLAQVRTVPGPCWMWEMWCDIRKLMCVSPLS